MKQNSSRLGDIFLSIAVCIQFFLIILQQCMIGILHMDPENTTIYRVIFSAIPIIISFYFIFKRDLLFAITTYVIALLIMLLHSIIFPDNEPYIWTQGVRFLLPICIPTMLAMRVVEKYENFNKMLIIISWCTIVLLFIYVICFFVGIVSIENYNMSFGYGLLLPTLVLYRQQTLFSKIIFLFASLSILFLGSRGPLLVIFAYVMYDIFCNNKRYIPIVLGMSILFVLSIPFLIDYLDGLGISSRTLNMFVEGTIDQDSGRGFLTSITVEAILEHPFFGLGIFSDRVLLEGIQPYCHNLFLELFVNWGIPLSIVFLFLLLRRIIKTYLLIKYKQQRMLLVLFFVSSFIPLMLSNSYLIDPVIWSFFGLLLFYNRNISKMYRNFYHNKSVCKKSR